MKKGLEEPKLSKRIHSLAAPRRLSHPASSASIKSGSTVKTIPSAITAGVQVLI